MEQHYIILLLDVLNCNYWFKLENSFGGSLGRVWVFLLNYSSN